MELYNRRDMLGLGGVSLLATAPTTGHDPAPTDPPGKGSQPPPHAATGGSDLYLDPADFGAEGDGTTDDSEALQDTIDAAASSGRPLHLGGVNRRYLVTIQLTASAGIHIIGHGATLIHQVSAGSLFTIAGPSPETPIGLMADAPRGTTALELATVHSIQEGDWLWLSSDRVWSTEIDQRYGEWVRVSKVATVSDMVELHSATLYGYAGSDSAKVERSEFLPGVRISGIKLQRGDITGVTEGLVFEHCGNVHISDIEGDAVSRPIRLKTCLEFSVRDCFVTVPEPDSLAFGVWVSGNSGWGLIDGVIGENLGAVVIVGVDGISRFVTVQSGKAVRAANNGFEAREGSDFISFHNLDVQGSVFVTSGHGVRIRGANATVTGVRVFGNLTTAVFIQVRVVGADGNSATVRDVKGTSFQEFVTVDVWANNTLSSVIFDDIQGLSGTSGAGAFISLLAFQENAHISDFTISNVKTVGEQLTRGIWVRGLVEGSVVRKGIISGCDIRMGPDADEAIYLQARTTDSVTENIVLVGNRTRGGSYGLRGVNTNHIRTVANEFLDATIANRDVAGDDIFLGSAADSI